MQPRLPRMMAPATAMPPGLPGAPVMRAPRADSLSTRLVVWGCGAVLGLLAADAVLGAYEAGLSPFKPSWFALLAVVFCAGATLLSGPRFAPAALLVLA
ncbi:MAG TPA: hypothetical protein PK490_20835, partial [Prosthecobacter sp.]|nr:hypothetical protein [Prosthecobacter sp.]